MEDHRELGAFLQARRARVAPEDVGLTTGARRRVRGLRREELAQLAGISVDYYVRLEQGRAHSPSDEVLDAIARTLGLDEVERSHLGDLAQPRRRTHRVLAACDCVRPELERLLEVIDQAPAVIMSRRMEALVWNPLLEQLFCGMDFTAEDLTARSFARYNFLDPHSREFHLDFEQCLRDTVGELRLAAGRYPDDQPLATLIGELSMKSENFRTLWAAGDVKEKSNQRKQLRHPLVGDLCLYSETFELPGGTGQKLITMFAAAGSPSEDALRLLGSWSAPAAAREPDTASERRGD